MKITDAYRIAIKLLEDKERASPGKRFKNSSGETIAVIEVAQALKRLLNWTHPELSSEDITKVTRCFRCKNYKRYKKRGDLKSHSFMACCLDGKKRDPMFFCAEGEESE